MLARGERKYASCIVRQGQHNEQRPGDDFCFGRYVVGENTQLKGRMRRSFVLYAFPLQPQLG